MIAGEVSIVNLVFSSKVRWRVGCWHEPLPTGWGSDKETEKMSGQIIYLIPGYSMAKKWKSIRQAKEFDFSLMRLCFRLFLIIGDKVTIYFS